MWKPPTRLLRSLAPFTADELRDTVQKLRKYRSLMWTLAKTENDNEDYYAIAYEDIQILIYGVYFTWEKYGYENGWIDSIAEEGEPLMPYQMFKINVTNRIEGLLQSMKFINIFEIFHDGKETNDMLILIYSDLLLNIKNGLVNLEY